MNENVIAEHQQHDFLDVDVLGEKIISYTRFLINNDSYNLLDSTEICESVNKEPSALEAKTPTPAKNVLDNILASDTQIFYIRLSDFLSEIEEGAVVAF